MFERMIRTALADTHTETEFLNLMHQMLKQEDTLKTEVRWSLFRKRMSGYAHGVGEDRRICAARMLTDLARSHSSQSERL